MSLAGESCTRSKAVEHALGWVAVKMCFLDIFGLGSMTKTMRSP